MWMKGYKEMGKKIILVYKNLINILQGFWGHIIYKL